MAFFAWLIGAAAAGSVLGGILAFSAFLVYLGVRGELGGMGPIGAFWAARMYGGPAGAVLGALLALRVRNPAPGFGWVLIGLGCLLAIPFLWIFAVNIYGWIETVRDRPDLITPPGPPWLEICRQDLPPAIVGLISLIGGILVLRGGR